MRNRASIEETQSKTENQTNIEEIKSTFEEEEDIIIKCGLEEMVRKFFEDYTIVWHDPNMDSEENKQYIAQLEKFCEVKTFTEWEKAVLCIQEAKAHCHVITSGTNGELFINKISQSPKISAIYVFCMNKEYHEPLTKLSKKISCVEIQIKDILDKVEENLLKWYKKESNLKMNLPAFAPVFNDWDKSGMNNLHRFLKIIPKFKNRSQAKNDLLALSRRIYSDKMNRKFMADFEKTYHEYNKEAILKWYTQESFVLKVANNCLRIASSDSIQYCRLLLKDLERAIKEQYHEKSKDFAGVLYRGGSLSDKEWLNLKSNLGREIEMHGFLSASKDKNQALKFIQLDESKNVFITILVPRGSIDEEQGFAEVEEFSRFPKEQEILFNVRSRLTVLETEDKYSEDVPCRHLVLLYGAQYFRGLVAEQDPVHEILIPNIKEISCSICQGAISENMLLTPINTEKVQNYFCKECLTSDILKAQNTPFLCVPMADEKRQIQKIKLKGFLMKDTLKIPMYGYECQKCQAKKQEMYYQCTECGSERREVWCKSCVDCLSECIQKGHHIIVEGSPFSFWCEKMSKKEFDHFKFQNEILEEHEEFQAQMHVESQENRKAIAYYKMYIEKNRDKKNKNKKIGIAYQNLAVVYFLQAESQKALEHHSQALEIFQSLSKKHHPHIVSCYKNMGNVYRDQAEYQKALEHYSQALDISKSLYGNNHRHVAECYNNIGAVYSDLAEYQKALVYFSQAREIWKSLYGNNHSHVAYCYNNMGVVYRNRAEYQKALENYSQALEIFQLLYGNNHSHVANCYKNMGNVYRHQAEYQKALEYYSQALKIYRSFYGNNHPEIAHCYNNMGDVYSDQAEYQKALEHHSRALEVYKSFYGDNHQYIATSLGNMGNIYRIQGEDKKALEYFSQTLEIFKSCYGDTHPKVANCYNAMGNVYCGQAEYHKALESYFKAVEICKSLYGDNHPHVADSLTGLGKTCFFLGEQKKALEYYFKSIEMKKSILNNHHPHLAKIYCNIGQAYNKLEQNKALEYHLKSLEIQKQAFHHENHPDIAESFTGLGRVHSSLGDHEKALDYLFKSLKIRKSVFHEEHPDVADCYHDLANIWKSQGKLDKALEHYSKSWEIRKLVLRENHPDTIAMESEKNEIQALFKDLENEKKGE